MNTAEQAQDLITLQNEIHTALADWGKAGSADALNLPATRTTP